MASRYTCISYKYLSECYTHFIEFRHDTFHSFIAACSNSNDIATHVAQTHSNSFIPLFKYYIIGFYTCCCSYSSTLLRPLSLQVVSGHTFLLLLLHSAALICTYWLTVS